MLAEVRLIIAPKEARLILKRGDDVVEDEVWTFDEKLTKKEAARLAAPAFHDAYDLMQSAAHGE